MAAERAGGRAGLGVSLRLGCACIRVIPGLVTACEDHGGEQGCAGQSNGHLSPFFICAMLFVLRVSEASLTRPSQGCQRDDKGFAQPFRARLICRKHRNQIEEQGVGMRKTKLALALVSLVVAQGVVVVSVESAE